MWLVTVANRTTIGLRTYVQKYGQMSEDVALGEDNVEFADWQLQIPLDTATVKHMLP